MPRAILFDFNGVIVNDEQQHCEALIATLAGYGYDLDRAQYYRDYLGFDDRECFRFTFERMGLGADEGLIPEAIERKAVLYEQAIRASLELVPGSTDFIRIAAEEGYRLAVISGASRREIKLVLDEAGLSRYFEMILAAEDVTRCKPDPEGYRTAREALRMPASACVIVEDSLPGLEAARSAGITCVLLATSHAAPQLTAADAVWSDFLGHHPHQLPWVA